MRTLILIAAITASFAAVYWFMIRPYLRAMPSLAETWERIDARERTLLNLIWARLDGYKTFLWSRFLILAGVLLPALQALEAVDLSQLVPAKYAPYIVVALALIGMITEYLRRVTHKPLELAPPEPVRIEPVIAADDEGYDRKNPPVAGAA